MKVLLGGWNTWNQQHATDPAKYPEGGASATPGSGSAPAPAGGSTAAVPQITIVLTPPANVPQP